ncbi:PD40 domain-containing protein [Streptomyces sannanensis]|uniref:PD40 domain-containing protein n=2 Tax=Streptomyces sannanensis TaxID=285536 RepID=A0ABP6S457_9ACTN
MTKAPRTAPAADAMTNRNKLLVLLASVLVLASVAGVVGWSYQADRKDHVQAGKPAAGAGTVSLAPGGPPRIVFRSLEYGPHRDELSSVPADAPDGPRTYSGVKCMRFYAAAGTGICLQSEMGAYSETYTALVLDSSLQETRRIPLAGIPNRARVSPSGHMAAWTVFVGGDGYAQKTFSTRTSILDTRTGALQPSLEEYAVTKDGKPFHPADANFWGVTFIDDEHFYATLGSGGKTYLIHGDVTTKTATTLRTNLECPSLSPDGTKIAFKKRVPGLPENLPWRLYVLDLKTMQEHPVAETRSLDDQVAWSDDNNLVYSLPDYDAHLYTVPADGSGAPRVLAREALSPAWVR